MKLGICVDFPLMQWREYTECTISRCRVPACFATQNKHLRGLKRVQYVSTVLSNRECVTLKLQTSFNTQGRNAFMHCTYSHLLILNPTSPLLEIRYNLFWRDVSLHTASNFRVEFIHDDRLFGVVS